MKTDIPFELPIRIEDEFHLVAADCELIATLHSATKEEKDALVALVNRPNIDVQDVCITAMYMAMGAEEVIDKMHTNSYELLSEHRGGHIGIMADLALLAEHSEVILAELKVIDYPGVYDYEVSGAFGSWFAENDPELEEAKDKLREMIVAWLAASTEVSNIEVAP